MKNYIGKIAVATALLFAAPVGAAPVQWQFVDTNFTGGGTITGGFTYDAALNVYSDISVLTTEPDGTTLRNTYVSDVFSSAGDIDLITAAGAGTGNPMLFVSFDGTLTDAGGFVGLGGWIGGASGAEGTCSTSNCGGFSPVHDIGSGAVESVAAIPVPAAGLMLLTGIAGMVGLRRRKKPAA